MLNDLNVYYSAATADLAVAPATKEFMRTTAACLEKTYMQFLRDRQSMSQYNIIFVSNSIQCCDFSRYFDYYRALLLKKSRLLQ